jgi:hypothetical protein
MKLAVIMLTLNQREETGYQAPYVLQKADLGQ